MYEDSRCVQEVGDLYMDVADRACSVEGGDVCVETEFQLASCETEGVPVFN